MAIVTVMIVDDDPDCRLLVRDAIEEAEQRRGGTSNAPLTIVEFDSGEAALDYLFRRGEWADPDTSPRPGLIYMDVEMPGMGGLEAVRRLKADPEFRDVPTVMLSGLSDAGAMDAAARNGANSYTVKSADAERLMQTVLTSTDYWLHVHQTGTRHLPQELCRR